MSITRVLSSLLLGGLVLSARDKGPTKTAAQAPAAAAAVPAASTTASTTASAAAAAAGQQFGAGVSLADATPIAAILADPARFKGKQVRVEGMVTDVCERRGCWFALAGDAPGQTLRFKVTDGEMVFPVEAKGKWAVAQGAVAVAELSLEQTREQAAEDAREKGQAFDPASVTQPTLMVRLDGTGALIRDKK